MDIRRSTSPEGLPDCELRGGELPYDPTTTAWASRRPGTLPGPIAARWNSWLPKPWNGEGNEMRKDRERGNARVKEKHELRAWRNPKPKIIKRVFGTGVIETFSWKCWHGSN